MSGILRDWIWYAITSISLLSTAVLWPRATSLDSFRDLAYSGFHDPMQGLHGIEPHFDLWNSFFHGRLRQGSDAEAVVWGSVDIFV
jgi:hypothetical protein